MNPNFSPARTSNYRHPSARSPKPARRRGAWCAAATLLLAGALGLGAPEQGARGAEPNWIWSPTRSPGAIPEGSCYFRRSFEISDPTRGFAEIAADDDFELFINGRKVAAGEGQTRSLGRHNISRYLKSGENLVAVRVNNEARGPAGLAVRISVDLRAGGTAVIVTDADWKATSNPFPLWHTPLYRDARWETAQTLGPFGATAPWAETVSSPTPAPREAESEPLLTPAPTEVGATVKTSRPTIQVDSEFKVERLLETENLGSLITMAFNEFGHIVASRENGGLILIYDSNSDGRLDAVRPYCDQVKNCQGLLPLNGEVFVTGEGPEGTALYRLSDEDRNGDLETVNTVLKFEGPPGEHGPHGLVLGPDGLLYIVTGNHTKPAVAPAETSPHRNYYEGDLVQPRYEDPHGHAVGRKAPGGCVLRVDLQGKEVELFAGGLRNPYDLAFNNAGELFTHDSDMESDEGTTWYHPTRLYHVPAGAEFGWRSGWAKWPTYYLDVVPPVLETGRGSPVGMVFYNHHMFPARFHDALFVGDWSQGKIVAITLERKGAGYEAETHDFLSGKPLNVTDLDIGPDGALYFCTGGRATAGALYRVSWRGTVPEAVTNLGTGVSPVIRQPQLASAVSRQKIAGLRSKLGDTWLPLLEKVARSARNPAEYRRRALRVQHLFGPAPALDLLVELSNDEQPELRAEAAMLLGQYPCEETSVQLLGLLADDDPFVRRRALEALTRIGEEASPEAIFPLLLDDDTRVAWAARRLLERQPVDSWREAVLETEDQRLFVQGALALLIEEPTPVNARAVLDRISHHFRGFVADRQFVDMLRVAQVALHRSQLPVEEAGVFAEMLAREYPTRSALLNRELVRLLAHLQVASLAPRYQEYLDSSEPDLEKLHLALHLRFIERGWSEGDRLPILRYLAKAESQDGGNSRTLYIQQVGRDMARNLAPSEAREVFARALEMPSAAFGAMYVIARKPDTAVLMLAHQLEDELAERREERFRQIRIGLVAILATDGGPESRERMRRIWDTDPDRRMAAAIGLAQHAEGEDWPYLIRSLSLVEGDSLREMLKKIASLSNRGSEPDHFRQVILAGLRLKEKGGEEASLILREWTAEPVSNFDDPWDVALPAWQAWFARHYPDSPPAELPQPNEEDRWPFARALAEVSKGTGDIERGGKVFVKARCIECHRFGDRGESMGPDLTSVAARFTKKEILESIYYPSHVISSQFASKTVITKDGRSLAGLLAPAGPNELTILPADGKRQTVSRADIEEILASNVSAMPTGLLNELELSEIADLFAFLEAGAQAAPLARLPSVAPDQSSRSLER